MPERGSNLLRFLAASVIAALLVSTVTLAFLARDLPDEAEGSRQFGAKDLKFVMGSGDVGGERIVIRSFTDGYALLSSGPVSVNADGYRFLMARLNRLPQGEGPVFFWRRNEAPADLLQVRIHESGTPLIDLSKQVGWRGEISELGFLFRDDGGEAVALGPTMLESDSLALRLRLTWDSWTSFEDWSQKSINFLNGGTFDQPVWLPLLAIGWIMATLALASLFFRLSGQMISRQSLVGGAAVFLVAWMVLDLRWTANSMAQFRQTTETYRGADAAEKLSRGPDGEIYRQIEHLKEAVLPKQPTRVLILGDDSAADFFLQRAKYHLLPHSARVTRRLPDALSPDSLGYVIYFGRTDELDRVPGWSPRWQKILRQIEGNGYGALYEVTKSN